MGEIIVNSTVVARFKIISVDYVFGAKRQVLIYTDLYELSNSVGIPQDMATNKNHFSCFREKWFNLMLNRLDRIFILRYNQIIVKDQFK
jgi:hypothetical protein